MTSIAMFCTKAMNALLEKFELQLTALLEYFDLHHAYSSLNRSATICHATPCPVPIYSAYICAAKHKIVCCFINYKSQDGDL